MSQLLTSFYDLKVCKCEMVIFQRFGSVDCSVDCSVD